MAVSRSAEVVGTLSRVASGRSSDGPMTTAARQVHSLQVSVRPVCAVGYLRLPVCACAKRGKIIP